MIFYYEWQLQEAYNDYKKTLPKASELLDIESFRRAIYEPLLNEMHDENKEE
tara:strand:- start:1339 stop:1494 length:156 start_codon:yes stop_codon:yes gene_type:complete